MTKVARLILAIIFVSVVMGAPSASAAPNTLIGAWSKDWKWFDANVGTVQIYHGYDPGFQYPTWNLTSTAKMHPNAMAYDYTFNIPPADVAAGLWDERLRTFIASTPADRPFYLTNYHEPEQEIDSGLFTASAFRASQAHIAALVHAQNLLDGGQRKVSLILMYDTFNGFKGRNPNTYWPTTTDCLATVPPCDMLDLVSVDTYSLPHLTGTAGIPKGYTDGLKWRTATTLLRPTVLWAQAHNTQWAVSELGILEDVNNPQRKANELTAAVNYAKANGALFIEYWDSIGPRADWQMRYTSPPVGKVCSVLATTNPCLSPAASAWKTAVAANP